MTTEDFLPPRPKRGPVVRREVAIGLAVTVFVTLAGAAMGLIWAGVAPGVAVGKIVANSSAAYRYQIGADSWFLLLGVLAGILSALVVSLVFGQRGPGAVIGLAVGGTLAAIVADRVGYLAAKSATTAALQAVGAHPDPDVLSQIDFRVRALGVLTAWPLVALVVAGILVAIDASRS